MSDNYDLSQKSSWTDEVLDDTGLLVACGVWLIATPVLMSYAGQSVAISDVAVGLVLASLSFWNFFTNNHSSVRLFVIGVLGLWLLISGTVLESTSKAVATEVFVGVVVIALTARIFYVSHLSRSGRIIES